LVNTELLTKSASNWPIRPYYWSIPKLVSNPYQIRYLDRLIPSTLQIDPRFFWISLYLNFQRTRVPSTLHSPHIISTLFGSLVHFLPRTLSFTCSTRFSSQKDFTMTFNWGEFKSEIERLYMKEGKSLEEVRDRLKATRKFNPS